MAGSRRGGSGGGDAGWFVGALVLLIVLAANPANLEALFGKITGPLASIASASVAPRPAGATKAPTSGAAKPTVKITEPTIAAPTGKAPTVAAPTVAVPTVAAPTVAAPAGPVGGAKAGSSGGVVTLSDPATALARLNTLQVLASEPSVAGYSRDKFGPAWTDNNAADLGGNGCNTRDDILLRDVDKTAPYKVAWQGACDHDMIAGTWHDPYDGTTHTYTDLKDPAQAQSYTIDHTKSLHEAWNEGANAWTDQQRTDYANDPLVLVATALNGRKSDKSVAEWAQSMGWPGSATDTAADQRWCDYARRTVDIDTKYRLPVLAADKPVLRQMIERCPR